MSVEVSYLDVKVAIIVEAIFGNWRSEGHYERDRLMLERFGGKRSRASRENRPAQTARAQDIVQSIGSEFYEHIFLLDNEVLPLSLNDDRRYRNPISEAASHILKQRPTALNPAHPNELCLPTRALIHQS